MTGAQDDIDNMLGARSTVSGHLREDHCLPPSPSLQRLLTGIPVPGPEAPYASPPCSDWCLRTMLLLLLPRCEEVREPRWGGVRGPEAAGAGLRGTACCTVGQHSVSAHESLNYECRAHWQLCPASHGITWIPKGKGKSLNIKK